MATMNNLFRLDDDVAVVIGGTGELGGVMAEALGAFGAKVAVVGRNAERGDARAARINDAGGEAKFFAADGLHGPVARRSSPADQDVGRAGRRRFWSMPLVAIAPKRRFRREATFASCRWMPGATSST